MAISTVKSTSLTGLDSVPVSLRQGAVQGNKLRSYSATIEVAATSTDEIGDIIKMVRIPSRLRVTAVKVYNDDIDSGTSALRTDIGLYNSATGAVVDADCFAAASAQLSVASTSGVNVANATQDIANIGKTAWELAGLSADPGVPLDVAFTVTTAANAGGTGTVSVVVEGTLDD